MITTDKQIKLINIEYHSIAGGKKLLKKYDFLNYYKTLIV